MSLERRPSYGLLVGMLAVGYVIGSVVPAGRVSSVWARADQFAEPRAVTAPDAPLPAGENAVVELFERASLSVVSIASTQLKQDLVISTSEGQLISTRIPEDRYTELRNRWLDGPGRLEVPFGNDVLRAIDPNENPDDFDWDSGSGIVWDRSGHLVTNFHVVRHAWNLIVRLPDLSDWPATVIGYDEDKDLAVLHIDAPPDLLYPAQLGLSRDLRVGQRAYSIGNPFGLSSTLTEGIISAVGRSIRSGSGRYIQDVIQTDAAINPGNSGGPLLDSLGRLIGVTTAMVSDSGSSAGIGFAVPIDTVNRIIPDLINFGRPKRAGLGIRIISELGDRIDGVPVASVLPGSAAEAAGLRGDSLHGKSLRFSGRADVIVAIDGERVRNYDDLYRLLDSHTAGDSVRVTYRRGDQVKHADIELQLLPLQEEPGDRLP